MRNAVADRASLPKTYAELVKVLVPRPIKDQAELENVQEIVDRLAVMRERTPDQEDYMEALSTFIEKYEAENDPILTDNLDPIDILAAMMEGREMSASDLGRLLGERTLGGKILSRSRQLSKAHISVLADHFCVSPALFFKRAARRT